jgi:hypothetical protein
MWLKEVLDRVVRNGEVPYQSNREAVEAMDIRNEQENGRQHLLVMLEGLDVFITNLEELQDVTETVAKQASTAAR